MEGDIIFINKEIKDASKQTTKSRTREAKKIKPSIKKENSLQTITPQKAPYDTAIPFIHFVGEDSESHGISHLIYVNEDNTWRRF